MSLLNDPANNDSTIIIPHGPVPVKKEPVPEDEFIFVPEPEPITISPTPKPDCEIIAPEPIKVNKAGKTNSEAGERDWKLVAEYRAKDIKALRKQIDEQSTRIREYINEAEEHDRDYKAQSEELERALDEAELWRTKCAEKRAEAMYWRAKFRRYALKKGDKKIADLAGDDPKKYNEDLFGDDDDLVF